MRSKAILIFFTVVLVIYSAANIFIYFRGAYAFRDSLDMLTYTIVFIILSFAFVAGKLLERNYSSRLSDILNIAGGFWLAFMLYSVLIILAADLLIVILRLTGAISPEDINEARQLSYLISFIAAFLLVVAGYINTLFPAIKKYSINIDKAAAVEELRIAAVSDIHLGSILGKRSMRHLSEMLESIKPRMVLFLGDLIDGEINPVLRNDLLESLTLPAGAKYNYAITGNHEYIGNHMKTIPYIESKGIKVLVDECVYLDEGIVLAGRKDRDSIRFGGEGRKDLDILLDGADRARPVILLDHQPPMKRDNELTGFDLMLSGHTHRGQIWPLNYLTSGAYKIIYGHRLINGSHYIVSSGFGSWGPRVRIGSRPEVLDITLKFRTHTDETASLSGSNLRR